MNGICGQDRITEVEKFHADRYFSDGAYNIIRIDFVRF